MSGHLGRGNPAGSAELFFAAADLVYD
jgi:hypothetical protein